MLTLLWASYLDRCGESEIWLAKEQPTISRDLDERFALDFQNKTSFKRWWSGRYILFSPSVRPGTKCPSREASAFRPDTSFILSRCVENKWDLSKRVLITSDALQQAHNERSSLILKYSRRRHKSLVSSWKSRQRSQVKYFTFYFFVPLVQLNKLPPDANWNTSCTIQGSTAPAMIWVTYTHTHRFILMTSRTS